MTADKRRALVVAVVFALMWVVAWLIDRGMSGEPYMEDIRCGGDGTCWIINPDGTVERYEPGEEWAP
jgi:hypothetical protein